MSNPLPVVAEALVRCEPYHTSLTRRACASRWEVANARLSGSGTAAIAKAALIACRGCSVGEERAAEEKRAPSPPLSTFAAEEVPMPTEFPKELAIPNDTVPPVSTAEPVYSPPERDDLVRRDGMRVVSVCLTKKQAALLDLLLDAGVYGDTDESACTYLVVEALTHHFPTAFKSLGFKP